MENSTSKINKKGSTLRPHHATLAFFSQLQEFGIIKYIWSRGPCQTRLNRTWEAWLTSLSCPPTGVHAKWVKVSPISALGSDRRPPLSRSISWATLLNHKGLVLDLEIDCVYLQHVQTWEGERGILCLREWGILGTWITWKIIFDHLWITSWWWFAFDSKIALLLPFSFNSI